MLCLFFGDGVDIINNISSINCSNIINTLCLYIFHSYMLVSCFIYENVTYCEDL